MRFKIKVKQNKKLQLCCSIAISPMKNAGRFPQGKPAATVGLPNLQCMFVSASIIHLTLTLGTGSLTRDFDLNASLRSLSAK